MVDLNPFAVLQIPDRPGNIGERIHPVVLSLSFGLAVAVFAVVAAAFEGNLGSLSDFQLVDDFRRVTDSTTDAGPQEFPLIRDVATWLLAGIVFLTLGLVWRQWQVFGVCLTGLTASGVLTERATPTFNRVRRLAGYHRVADGGDLSQFVSRVNTGLRIASYGLALVVVVSVILAFLLARSYESLGVFRLWNVDGSGVSDGAFARQAYTEWWASSEHLAGYLVYLSVSVIGIFVILLQNVVGMAAVYVIGGLPAFCDFAADWYDQDGNYGWHPLGKAFRTVRVSLLVHGVALTVLFAMVGAGVWAYTVPLLCLWLLVIPLYLGVPALVFRGVGSEVKARTLRRAAGIDARDVVRAAFVVPYVRQASIKPLRVNRFGVYAFFGSILLPIFLTAAQIAGT
jgi:hypothetical protein